MDIFKFKYEIYATIGVIGAIVSHAFGGWTDGMTALVIAMCIDYITGLAVGGVFHKSNKTQDGRLSSHEGWKGIIKKLVTMLLIVLAVQIDIMLTLDHFVRDAVVIGFFANECVSIIENTGLMGLPLPKALIEAIEVLKQKADIHIKEEKKDGDDNA